MNRFSHALKRNVFIIGVAFIVASCLFMSRASADTTDTARDGRLVTIHDRGETHVILTHAQTVRDALNDAHVAVVSQDTVEPSLDDRLMATDYTVNIYRARPVIVVDGAVRVKVMTAEQTAEGIVNTAGIPLHDEDRTTLAPSTNIVADGAAEILTIDRAKRFTLNLYGTPITAYSHEDTVGAMLAAKHITLSKDDTLSVSPDMPLTAGMTVAIWRNGIQTATVEKDIAFPVRQIQDFDHPIGYSKVQTPGVKGKKSVTYEITIRDGKEVKRKVIQTVIITQPKEQIEVVGAAPPPGSHQDWMAAAGIAKSDYGFVSYIVDHENRSWDPCKIQGGAVDCSFDGKIMVGYGLVQATPGGKMSSAGSDWRTNPVTQLKWATSYAVGRYGSWQKAYEFWLANNHW